MIGICRRILFVSMREDNEDKGMEGGGDDEEPGAFAGEVAVMLFVRGVCEHWAV